MHGNSVWELELSLGGSIGSDHGGQGAENEGSVSQLHLEESGDVTSKMRKEEEVTESEVFSMDGC